MDADVDAGLHALHDAAADDAGADACPATCKNSDPTHCIVHCDDDARACVVSARDADGDGYGDASCLAAGAAATDCDDTSPDVHPGARELCNARDDDCNGRIDLADGLPPPKLLEPHFAGTAGHIAFDGERYGVAYTDTQGRILFGTITSKGDQLLDGALVDRDESFDASQAGSVPALAFGDGVFGVAWARGDRVRYRFITPSGSPVGDVQELSAAPSSIGLWSSLTFVGTHSWLLFQTATGDELPIVGAHAFTTQGEALPFSLPAEGLEDLPSVATGDGQTAIAYGDVVKAGDPGGADVIAWRRFNANLALIGDKQQLARLERPAHASSPLIARAADRYAIAWTERLSSSTSAVRRVLFGEFDLQGKPLCDVTDLALRFDEGALPLTLVAMAVVPTGYVLLGFVNLPAGEGLGVDLVHVRTGCQYVQRFRARTTLSAAPPSLASAGAAGFVVLSNFDEQTLSYQLFGPTLCD